MRRAMILLAVLATARGARADQCAWVNQAQATKAAELLKVGGTVVEWCEPCGDKPPTAKDMKKVENMRVAPVKDDRFYSELSINGKGVDLAYVFVMTKPGEFQNLAKLSGCPATGVSKSFRLGAGPSVEAPERGRTFQEMESEAGRNLRALYSAERMYFDEHDRFTQDLPQTVFHAEACPNGSRPGTPSDEWVGGCNFIYRVELNADGTFTGRARCVSGAMVDEELIISSGGKNPGKPLKPDQARR